MDNTSAVIEAQNDNPIGTTCNIPKLRVLVVDEELKVWEAIKTLLENWGHEVFWASNGKSGFEMVKRCQPHVILANLVMGKLDGMGFLEQLKEEGLLEYTTFIFLSAHGNIDTAVQATKNGAHDFLTKPLDEMRLKIILEKVAQRAELDKEVMLLRDKVRKLGTFGKLNGSTPKMKNVFKQIQIIAPTTASVLITGESGTGKELVAKAISNNSKRKEKPYIAINCAAIPATLLENEFFGHERGAFTGAFAQEAGCFEIANGGTIFLDEIGEMPLDMQTKILRVLENGTFRRIGGKKEIFSDVRIVAATNKSLEEMVEEGAFREDLYYRLNVFTIKIPPLRERGEDILLLAQHFIEEFNLKNDRQVRGMTKRALHILKKYSWPGNVRELKNALERAVIVCNSELIDENDLPEALTSKADKAPTIEFRLGQTMDEVEKHFLFHTINFVDGNKTKAAKMLNISLKTLHNKLAKYKSSI